MFGKVKPEIKATDVIIREAVADVLRARKGTIDPAQFHTRRLDLETLRPIRCGSAKADEERDE
jgi:hypothetical protein